MQGVSLFSGYGGIDLGLSLVIPDYRTIAYCEIGKTQRSILQARMDDGCLDRAPIYEDIRTFDGTKYQHADIIHAGFPCQAFSSAARGRNVAAKNLWPETLRVIGEVMAPLVFLENVKESPIKKACEDLGEIGYSTVYGSLSALHVGAPHARKRFMALGYTHGEGEPDSPKYAEMAWMPSVRGLFWRRTDPANGLRMDDGRPAWLDRCRVLGNGVIPAMAAIAFMRLVALVGGGIR